MSNANEEPNENIPTKYQVPSTKYQVPSTKYQVPSTKYPIFYQLFCLVLAFAAFSLSGIASAADALTQVYPAFSIPFGAKPTPIDRLSPNQQTTPMKIVLGLALRDRAGLENYVLQASTPGHENFGSWLTVDQVDANYGATAAQIAAVKAFLTSNNLTVDPTSDGAIVKATGLPATIENAFQTRLGYYTLRDGRNVFLNTAPISIPTSLIGTVESVLGLENVRVVRPAATTVPPTIAQVAATYGNYDTSYLTKIYGISNTPGLPDAGSINVGIITVGDVADAVASLNDSRKASGKNAVNIAYRGATNQTPRLYLNDPWAIEMRLDLQTLVEAAGQVRTLLLYQTNESASIDLKEVLNLARSEPDLAKVISISFGACEWMFDSFKAGDKNYFLASTLLSMAAQGQTVFVASGDSGSRCSPSENQYTVLSPASDPYVVAVGGTFLPNSNTFTNLGDVESGWLYSGGGYSKFLQIPPWQTAAGIPGTKRAIPDVALPAVREWINSGGFQAPGLTFLTSGNDGKTYQYQRTGGTSFAAPMMAGLWARQLASGCDPNLGFAAPWLYRFIGTSVFNDIKTMETQQQAQEYSSIASATKALPWVSIYQARPGWDEVTGLGSVNAANMLAVCKAAAVARPTLTVNHFPVSPVVGGTVHFTWATTGTTKIVVSCSSQRVSGFFLNNFEISQQIFTSPELNVPTGTDSIGTTASCEFTAYGPGGRSNLVIDSFLLSDPNPVTPTAKFSPTSRGTVDPWSVVKLNYDYTNATSVSNSCTSSTSTLFWPPGPKTFNATSGTYTYPVDPYVIGPGAQPNNNSSLAGSTNACTWTATGPGGVTTPFVDSWTVNKVGVLHYPEPVIPGANLKIEWAISPDTTALNYSCTSSNGGWNSSGSKPISPAVSSFSMNAPVQAHSTTICTWTAITPDGPETATDTWVVP